MESAQQAHTLGPWSIHQSQARILFIEAPNCELAVAKVSDSHPRAVDFANARLIAAAPDLLEALERLAIFHQPTHPKHGDMHEEYAEDCIANEISYSSATLLDSLVRAANAAIAKARGEGA